MLKTWNAYVEKWRKPGRNRGLGFTKGFPNYPEPFTMKVPFFLGCSPAPCTARIEQQLPRWQAVLLGRLRTGCIPLNAHLYKINLAESPECECLEGPQTVEHILIHCPHLGDQRCALRSELGHLDLKLMLSAADDARVTVTWFAMNAPAMRHQYTAVLGDKSLVRERKSERPGEVAPSEPPSLHHRSGPWISVPHGRLDNPTHCLDAHLVRDDQELRGVVERCLLPPALDIVEAADDIPLDGITCSKALQIELEQLQFGVVVWIYQVVGACVFVEWFWISVEILLEVVVMSKNRQTPCEDPSLYRALMTHLMKVYEGFASGVEVE
ncbi:Uu.00g088660.m01.CDS01 [Anthostomella pinea]|uniref:Uu.00g088660.m01.CDS01 n=1 Tax=Anthostomella pinea TaxID=933095 RepID=A0AAI8YK36_9PEZI|nr:Uu.00g088660.m01.CDS01 [Anthostomella pinea]